MITYLVRHGQSEGNKQGLFQTSDVPLSEDGIKQAESLAKRLKNIHFDFIYSSPVFRAKQTARIINKEINTPVEFWDNLIELRTPSEIKGKRIDDKKVIKIRGLIEKNAHKENFRYSDEETFNELNERAKQVLKHLEHKHKNQTVLCISHSTAIKAIIGKIIFGDELTPKIFLKMRFHMWAQNTGITVCERTEKYGWTLTTWNDMTHI